MLGRKSLLVAALLAVLLSCCCLRAAAVAADSKPAKPGSKQDFWDANKQGQFITALCTGLDGSLWVGTEDRGLWRFDPTQQSRAKAWTQFTRKSTGGKPETSGPALTSGTSNENALGDDNAYALACDELGRIWVGHLNHGVSVYNGQAWRNYDVLSGPLGERVFDIAVCPVDSDVWIATSAGLARYSLVGDTWSYYTRANGLVSDQVEAVAFDKNGHIYAGTQCDGLMKAARTARGEYLNWQHIPGAESMPHTPTGKGLPSSLINDVLVASDSAVYVATTCGLARSRDGGRTWEYTRGNDWEEKVKGLYRPTKPVWNTTQDSLFLKEDHIACLEEGEGGTIWIGYWIQGWSIIDPKRGPKTFTRDPRSPSLAKNPWQDQVVASSPTKSKSRHYVSAIAPIFSAVGTYGEGMQQVSVALREANAASGKESSPPLAPRDVPKLPAPATSPTSTDGESALGQGNAAIRRSKPMSAKAVYLGEDWMTQGDCFGRYGRKLAVFCAANSPWDQVTGAGLGTYLVTPTIGPHRKDDDMVRNWCWAVKSDERRVPYLPMLAVRRPSGWDDHGEAYPWTHEGPDVWIFVQFDEEGLYEVDLYFVNYDGQRGDNRFRDYLIEVRDAANVPLSARTLAKTRVREWYGGVHKQFAVQGPGKYGFRIGRNNSFNTMVMAVMLDKLQGPPDAADGMALPWMGNLPYGSRDHLASLLPASRASDVACFDENREALRRTGLELYRSLERLDGTTNILQWLRWRMRLWTIGDRDAFDVTTEVAWRKMQEMNPQLKSKEWRKHSPNTQ